MRIFKISLPRSLSAHQKKTTSNQKKRKKNNINADKFKKMK